MMVLMAKLPSKLLPLANVYRPTGQVHAANDALMVKGYKHMMGTSRYPTQTPSVPRPQGRARSSRSWHVAVVREWVPYSACAKEEFRASQAYTVQTHEALRGACPAVLTLGQYTHHPQFSHLIHTSSAGGGRGYPADVGAGPLLGNHPYTGAGPRRAKSGAMAARAPRVEV